MLVYGGMTENGADDSLWSFNITSLRWSKVRTNVKCAFNVKLSHDCNSLHFCGALSWSESVLIESRTCLVAEKSFYCGSQRYIERCVDPFTSFLYLLNNRICYLRFN